MHGHLPKIDKSADLVLISGDICCHGKLFQQLSWLDTTFRYWLKSIKCPVVACAGNHDWPFYKSLKVVESLNLPWIYLQDDSVIVDGIKIYGTPWQNKFFDWAFNLDGEVELSKKWELIPNDTDILISHSPPYGVGDNTPQGLNVGSALLLSRIEHVKPALSVFGHIHNGRGAYKLSYDTPCPYDTLCLNASVVDERYRMVYNPWIVKYDAFEGVIHYDDKAVGA
jgi:Icc-related predicted phosphoesterase